VTAHRWLGFFLGGADDQKLTNGNGCTALTASITD
jgi:hypothetical protein